MGLFSFFYKSHYTFEGKKDYEKVITLLYRHWFVLFLDIFLFLILAFLPTIIYRFLGGYIADFGLREAFLFLASIYYLFWWLGLFYRITMYLLDIWIITDHRILDNEQHGLFKRVFSEMNIAKVQDMSVTITGVIPTLLDYGNLEIQTAGTKPKFVLKQIPHPNQVKAQITDLHKAYLGIHKDGIEVHEQTGV